MNSPRAFVLISYDFEIVLRLSSSVIFALVADFHSKASDFGI